ncbi:MAG: transcription-repair coupling factor, partial [Rhodoluna sp.]
MSEENLKALSRLGTLISEGYSFAALQAKIKSQRVDLIAPQSAMPAVVDVISRFRSSAKLSPVHLLVVSTGREAEDVAATLRALDPSAEILEFPSWETLPHERLSPSPETVGRRLKVLHRLNELAQNAPEHAVYVLASVRAVLQPVVAGLANHPPLMLEQGSDYLLFELSLKLVEMAYHRVDMVTKRGEFAVRGGILDIFPTTAEHALRLEFFGDELEDVREFSVADQRSIHNADGTISN